MAATFVDSLSKYITDHDAKKKLTLVIAGGAEISGYLVRRAECIEVYSAPTEYATPTGRLVAVVDLAAVSAVTTLHG